MSCAWEVRHGDCLATLRTMPDASFDAVLTDPPSGISFMNKEWDSDKGGRDAWIAWLAEIVKEICRVLRPGAYGLVWALPRTSHWTATALEDGGLELRDRLCHLFGTGYPKPATTADKLIDSHLGIERPIIGTRTLTGNAAVQPAKKGGTLGIQVGTVPTKIVNITGPGSEEAKRWEGYGMALKPAVEDWFLVRNPLDGTTAKTCLDHGTGALNIQGARIGLSGGTTKADQTPDAESRGVYGRGLNGSYAVPIDLGRWPSHLVLDEEAAAMLDAQAGEHPSTLTGTADPSVSHRHPMAGTSPPSPHNLYGHGFQAQGSSVYAEGGGPSRFFFVAKPSTAEREFGCEHLPLRGVAEMHGREEGSAGLDSPSAGAGRGGGARNPHPTIKGVTLTTWLATLLLPPARADRVPRRICCPFAGSGGEMIGAMRAGWDEIIGIEMDPEFVEIAKARMTRWAEVPAGVDPLETRPPPVDERQTSLFGK